MGRRQKIARTRPRLILFNKPFGVLSKFSGGSTGGLAPNLASYLDVPEVYPAGRLDRDSEGLLLLTNDGRLQAQIANPRYKLPKTYLVQVEGDPEAASLDLLRLGVALKDGPTRPAEVERIRPPDLWPRDPPVRFRKTVPDSWLRITIREGRNRQVRRMTAAAGHPTLRLVRWRVGDWSLDGLAPGASREVALAVCRLTGRTRPVAIQGRSADKASSGAKRRDREQVKRDGWHEQQMLAVSLDDHRLTWPERELVRQLGEKLYGKLPAVREMRHG